VAKKRKQYDWEAIEREYRAGQLSISEIARQGGCSRAAVYKAAKKNNWQRDLTHRVRQATNTKLVTDEVTGDTYNETTETEIVETAASRAVEVVRSHRTLIRDTIQLATNLINMAHSEQLDMMAHSQLFRTVSQGLAKVIPLERQAFNLDEKDPNPGENIEKININFVSPGNDNGN
jgi:predicted DNA-binding protein YlxM (UPF0122 family)